MRAGLFVIGLCLIALSSSAATWHVAKDGSGDFTVIQDGIDAASPGDTVWVHAGRYEELTEDCDLWGNGAAIADVHVVVNKGGLTLRGDGPDVTIIGPLQEPSPPNFDYVGIAATSTYASSLVVIDLAVENVSYGIYAGSNESDIAGCRFEEAARNGLRLHSPSYATVRDCVFIACGNGVGALPPCGVVQIADSRYLDNGNGILAAGAGALEVLDCEFLGGVVAVDIQQGTPGTLRRISADGYQFAGVVTSVDGEADIYDCSFSGGLFGLYAHGSRVRCEGSTFTSNTDKVVWLNTGGASVIRGCDLNNGGGLTVYCDYNGSSDCQVDMVDNFWGSDSEEQIAEWIDDSIDDPDRCCTVDFIPFNNESTPTESKSWSSVKGLFKAGGDE